MEKTLGLLGDLCCEAEQTWRRMRSIRRCLDQCLDKGLHQRLISEATQYFKRCKQIQTVIQTSLDLGALDSLQVQLLDEILARILVEEIILQQP